MDTKADVMRALLQSILDPRHTERFRRMVLAWTARRTSRLELLAQFAESAPWPAKHYDTPTDAQLAEMSYGARHRTIQRLRMRAAAAQAVDVEEAKDERRLNAHGYQLCRVHPTRFITLADGALFFQCLLSAPFDVRLRVCVTYDDEEWTYDLGAPTLGDSTMRIRRAHFTVQLFGRLLDQFVVPHHLLLRNELQMIGAILAASDQVFREIDYDDNGYEFTCGACTVSSEIQAAVDRRLLVVSVLTALVPPWHVRRAAERRRLADMIRVATNNAEVYAIIQRSVVKIDDPDCVKPDTAVWERWRRFIGDPRQTPRITPELLQWMRDFSDNVNAQETPNCATGVLDCLSLPEARARIKRQRQS